MKKVLIKPLWPDGLGGRLFDACYPWSFQKWREAALEEGIELLGWDTAPIETADCVWFLDLSETKKEFNDARRRARRGVPFVLQVMETPAIRKNLFLESNRKLFDFIVTYEHKTRPRNNHFYYRLPHGFGGFSGVDKLFSERRCALMVGANKHLGFLAVRSAANHHLPGWGVNLGGWRVPCSAWIQPARGELLTWRRKLARQGQKMPPGTLDIIGSGWGGQRISWFRLLPLEKYRNHISSWVPNKLEAAANYRFLIAAENYRGCLGYISEKIFDAFVAGVVPVYLGDERIQEIVPPEAFVDARRFRSQHALLDFLRWCPQREWEIMRSAGQEFLKSLEAKAFSTEAFVANMNSILKKILN